MKFTYSKILPFVKKIMVIALGLGVMTPMFVFAQKYGLEATAGAAQLTGGIGSGGDISTFIGTLIGTALSFIGIVFFILMLYGGFLWMTARGNEDQTSKAIGTITAGAIGMVIIMASYTITSFLFTSLGPAAEENSGSEANFATGEGDYCPAGYESSCVGPGEECLGQRLNSSVNCSANQFLCCRPQVAGNVLCCTADDVSNPSCRAANNCPLRVLGIVPTTAACQSQCNGGSGLERCTTNDVPAADCSAN